MMTAKQSTVCCLALSIAVCCAKLLAQDAVDSTDASGEERQRERVFNVEHAPIDSVANTLEAMFEGDGNKWSLMVTGKRLRVKGTQEQLQAAADLISKVDRVAKSERKERVFMLKRPANARDFVVRFEELFGDDDKWSVNVANDRIHFFGTEEQIQAASQLIATLDEPHTSFPPATDSNRERSNAELRVFRSDRIDVDMARRVLATLMEGSKDFRIEADSKANQLIVAGTADDVEKVDTILRTLGEVPTARHGGEQELRVFNLLGLDAHVALTLIQSLVGDAPNLRIDGTATQLFVRGSAEQIEFVANVLDELQKTEERQTKIFTVTRSDATELAAMLKELFGGKGLSISVDQRTNAIVASANQQTLQVIQAILLKLDAVDTAARKDQSALPATELPPTATEEFAAGPNSPGDRDFHESQGEYASTERNAATRAAIYRWAEASGGSSDEELGKMKQDLQTAVERAFAARQQAQSADVAQLRRQLTAIETRVRQREAIKGQIIERRVEDLLANVDTSWWPQTPAASGNGTVTQVRPLPDELDAQELPNPQGKVEIEYVEGLDILVLRGKESDVQSVLNTIEGIERKAADTHPQGSTADEPATQP